jgi:hypothetical protein
VKKIKSKLIYISEKNQDSLYGDNPKRLRESKYISFDKLPFKSDITIFDDKIALTSNRSMPIGVIIEDSEIAESLKSIFDYLWKK